jgi:hypothetical protein
MKINSIQMKHMMHSAGDLVIDYQIDLINRTMVMNVGWIDTSLIEDFLRFSAVSYINQQLGKVGKLPLITKLNGFAIELVVAERVRYEPELIERDFEPKQPTLVMKMKG